MDMDRSALRAAAHDDDAGSTIPELDSIAIEEEKKRQPDFQRAKKSVQMPDSTRGVLPGSGYFGQQ
jgi:hypothetical protein